MRVGITLTIKKDKSLFSNGLRQNCFMLYDVFSRMESVSDIYIVNTNFKLKGKELKEVSWVKDYNVITWNKNIKDELDVLITLDTVPAEKDLAHFKDGGKNKIVGYKGGNSFVMHTEDILFNGRFGENPETKKHGVIISDLFDEIWMVPQQEYHNKQYFELTHNCEAKSVPFVWSPKFIEELVPLYAKKGLTPHFDDKNFDKWKIASIEPNLSVLKNLLPIIYSCEYAYKKNPESIHEINIMNTTKLLKNETLVSIVNTFKSHKDKKIIFDSRYNIVYTLSKFADMIVSNQWGNALNYAYLDTVYFGTPLIHNAHLCKDIGYYYEDFNMKDAGDLILEVIDKRKSDKDYTARNREIIKRYTIENKEMINQYELLLKNLFEKNEINGKQYDWKTNLLK